MRGKAESRKQKAESVVGRWPARVRTAIRAWAAGGFGWRLPRHAQGSWAEFLRGLK
jgi:hypothetical protein